MNVIVRKSLLGIMIPVIVVLLWIYATAGGKIPIGILPPISLVFSGLKEMLQTGELKADILVSLSRVLKGYLIAAVIGIILGSLIGMYRPVREMLMPLLTIIRQIPIIAWIPLIILWAGIGELSKVIVIVLAAFFPILVNTEAGIEKTPGGILEVAKLYRLRPWETFTKVYLPHALSHILVGLKLGLGVSWMAVVAAEMIAATNGIGYKLNYSRSMMHANKVIVCMIVIGLIGVAMDKLIGWIFGLLTPWERVNMKTR